MSRGSENVGSNRRHPFFFFFGDISSLKVRNKVCACLDVSTLVSKYHFELHYDDTNPRTNVLGLSLRPKMTCSFPRKIVEDLDKKNY